MKKLMIVVWMLVAMSAQAGDWKYSSHEDEMRGTKTNSAFLPSTNAVNFQFPYNGGSHLLVMLNKELGINGHSECGYVQCTAVLLGIFKGQFDCLPMHEESTDTDVCYVSVKFDDGPVEKYVVKKNNQESVYLRHDSNIRFLEKLTKANKLTIEASFYNDGPRQFKYDVKDLKWIEDREAGTLSGYSQPDSVW